MADRSSPSMMSTASSRCSPLTRPATLYQQTRSALVRVHRAYTVPDVQAQRQCPTRVDDWDFYGLILARSNSHAS
jgi:hypothetical protein